jgi:hypothetical protein
MARSLARAKQEELESLERDRERIDAALRAPGGSPMLEAMLRAERRWVVQRERALERVVVASRAVLVSGGVSRPCLVRDVSAHGAGLDTDVQPRVGEAVRLVLADLDGAPALDAVVRHATGRRVGLEFVPHGEEARAAAELLARRWAVGEG